MSYTLPENLYGKNILTKLLSKYNLSIKSNGKIIYQTWKETSTITRDYIGITDILYSSLSDDGAIIDVSYQTSDDICNDFIERTLPVTISFNAGISFDSSVLSNDLKRIIKDKRYFQRIQSLYQNYFRDCMKEWLRSNPGLLFQCGWFKEDRKELSFKSITYRDSETTKSPYSKIDSLIFNGLVSEFSHTTPDNYLKNHNLHNFFDFLQNKHALFLFTCTIHSLLLDYSYNHIWNNSHIPNADTAIFSLCIHGKEISHVKKVANLLLNVFDISKEHWTVISRKIHKSASSIISSKIDSLRMYSDVPILFTTRTNRFYKSSGIIKKIHTKRQQGYLHIFPVYISETPIIADEIINCCVDDISTDFDLDELHSNMCFFLYFFINILSEIYRTKDTYTSKDYQTIMQMTNQLIEHLHTSLTPDNFIQLTEKKLPEILLMSSLKSFCYIFSLTPTSQYTNILTTSFESYISNSKDITTISTLETVNYILLIAEFIHESINIEENNEWLFESTEKKSDGTTEPCYCLTTQEGFNHFLSFLKERKIKAISTRYFTRTLESKDILKTLASSTAKCNKRRAKNVYIIKKEALESALI